MENRYRDAFLNASSRLDAVTDANGGIIKLAMEITDQDNDLAVVNLCKRISYAIDMGNPRITKLAETLKDELIKYCGYISICQKCKKDEANHADDEKTLTELMGELESLVGLERVKSTVNDLIAYQKVQKLREAQGLHSEKNTMHLAFTGNPGTGKTTVARIVGRIYKQIGLLSKGHFTEVSRTDLIAGYQGQTALKVKNVIEQAKGGVLFIDEAYSITENDHADSYGRECLTELTKALEDYRDDLVVIVAGYTEPMKKFFESNPGLKSRFNTFIEFDDYNEEELEDILIMRCMKNCYQFSDSALEKVKDILTQKVAEKDEEFANGRLARNMYDDIVMNHARRVANIPYPSKEQLMLIESEDVN